MQKATPVYPPLSEGVVEVDMTKLYFTVGALVVTLSFNAGVTGYLFWKQRQIKARQEALGDFTARLVNITDCGSQAYASFLEEIEEEDDE